MRNQSIIVAFVTAMALAPLPARGQSLPQLLQSIASGGGWVEIPIHDGRGTLSTGTVPTAGMTLQGCFRVYKGLSGSWDIQASDSLGGGDLHFHVAPGQPTPFTYHAGARGRLKVDIHWSEPRDTTFFVWVGLRSPLQPDRDPCVPG